LFHGDVVCVLRLTDELAGGCGVFQRAPTVKRYSAGVKGRFPEFFRKRT
jgi:hypothetical protein